MMVPDMGPARKSHESTLDIVRDRPAEEVNLPCRSGHGRTLRLMNLFCGERRAMFQRRTVGMLIVAVPEC